MNMAELLCTAFQHYRQIGTIGSASPNDHMSAQRTSVWWRFNPVYCFPLLLAEACKVSVRLEALAVDDGGAALVVLLLGDPHLLEGGEGSQDGASDPDGVLPLGGSDDLDLDGGGGKGGDLLLHAVSNTGVHGGASRHDG